jgi:sugar O-acyltransferase (sialic acid O-acetyltransferase NeuD family)
MKDLILIGAGGHAKSCIDVIEQENKFKIVGLIDLPERIDQDLVGYKIIDCDENLSKYVKLENYFLITIGQIESAQKRIGIFKKLQSLKANIATIISPLAYVSRFAKIDYGTIIMHHVLVNSAANIGKNCIINTKALIEHDAVIQDHCHISTASIINGCVEVGEGSFVGSNSTTKNNIIINSKSFIKAGSVAKKF